MAQSSTAEAFKINVSDKYSSYEDDKERFYIAADFEEKYNEMSEIVGILSPSSIVDNRGDFCVSTKSIVELKDLAKRVAEISNVITFPNKRSLCCDTDEILEKIQFAMEYDFPFINEKNTILPELFDFYNNESNYLKSYYLSKTLYTPEEKGEDVKFRDLDDIEKYYRFCGELQKMSYMCFGKLLKPNEKFDSFVIYGLNDDEKLNNYDEFVAEALGYLKNEENPFLDVNRIYQSVSSDLYEIRDLGVRR